MMLFVHHYVRYLFAENTDVYMFLSRCLDKDSTPAAIVFDTSSIYICTSQLTFSFVPCPASSTYLVQQDQHRVTVVNTVPQ
jgi:hypothetical protein